MFVCGKPVMRRENMPVNAERRRQKAKPDDGGLMTSNKSDN